MGANDRESFPRDPASAETTRARCKRNEQGACDVGPRRPRAARAGCAARRRKIARTDHVDGRSRPGCVRGARVGWLGRRRRRCRPHRDLPIGAAVGRGIERGVRSKPYARCPRSRDDGALRRRRARPRSIAGGRRLRCTPGHLRRGGRIDRRCRRSSGRHRLCGSGLSGRRSTRSRRRNRSRGRSGDRSRRRLLGSGLGLRRSGRRWGGRRHGCSRRVGSTPRRKQAERIDVGLARTDSDAEMDVRDAVLGLARRPDLGDQVSSGHRRSASDPQRAEVRERHLVPVGRRDGHRQPVRGNLACEGHLAGDGRPNGVRVAHGDVDATVLSGSVRVVTERERAQDDAVDRPAPGGRRRCRDEREKSRERNDRDPSRCHSREHGDDGSVRRRRRQSV